MSDNIVKPERPGGFLDFLPKDFLADPPVPVYTPRQIGVIRSASEPLIYRRDGMMADNDSRDIPQEEGLAVQIMAPPRCYALKWYRVSCQDPSTVECRFKKRFTAYSNKGSLSALPQPKFLSIFQSIQYIFLSKS